VEDLLFVFITNINLDVKTVAARKYAFTEKKGHAAKNVVGRICVNPLGAKLVV
jgi:hypothetical protein